MTAAEGSISLQVNKIKRGISSPPCIAIAEKGSLSVRIDPEVRWRFAVNQFLSLHYFVRTVFFTPQPSLLPCAQLKGRISCESTGADSTRSCVTIVSDAFIDDNVARCELLYL